MSFPDPCCTHICECCMFALKLKLVCLLSKAPLIIIPFFFSYGGANPIKMVHVSTWFQIRL